MTTEIVHSNTKSSSIDFHNYDLKKNNNNNYGMRTQGLQYLKIFVNQFVISKSGQP